MANYSTRDFEFIKDTQVFIGRMSQLGLTRFPDTLEVTSSKTGDTRTFAYDNAVNAANEFFDGEGCAYTTTDGIKLQLWN